MRLDRLLLQSLKNLLMVYQCSRLSVAQKDTKDGEGMGRGLRDLGSYSGLTPVDSIANLREARLSLGTDIARATVTNSLFLGATVQEVGDLRIDIFVLN